MSSVPSPTSQQYACDVNKILTAEECIVLKAICAEANPCELQAIACDIKGLDSAISSLYYDVSHGLSYVGAAGNVLGDLVDLLADAVLAGVNPDCAEQEVACIGVAVDCLTGVSV